MGDLNETRQSEVVRIAGGDENYIADVELVNGKKRILTDSIVTVEQLFGQDNFADVWFWIDRAGAVGDIVTVSIPAYSDPSGSELSVPAVNFSFTLTANEAGKEIELRSALISALNANANFSPYWKATAIKDNPIVHISSKFIGEYGERPTFAASGSGTTQIRIAYANIRRRGKANSGQRDPNDRRLVTVGVSGEVTAVPGAVGDLFLEKAKYLGSADMLVNGTLADPITFSILPSLEKDIFIKELRFFGNANGIKFGQFLARSTLPNGILVEIRSDSSLIQFDPIQTTDDFKHMFSFGSGQGFQLHVQAGRDDFLSSFVFDSPFPIRKSGTNPVDDYIKVLVRDNLTSGALSLNFAAFGFEREV